MIVLDANVLIAVFDRADAHNAAAVALLRDSADEVMAANTVTLAEALVAPARRGRLDEALEGMADLDIEEIRLPEGVVVPLAELRASSGLRMPDCLVLLSAQLAGAAVATFDHRLRSAALHHGVPLVASPAEM